MCECVCERETEREKERGGGGMVAIRFRVLDCSRSQTHLPHSSVFLREADIDLNYSGLRFEVVSLPLSLSP